MYAASEGLTTLLIERDALGGQAGSSSMIRNYLGFPRGVSGAQLAQHAFNQAWQFGARPYITRPVTGLLAAVPGYELTLNRGPSELRELKGLLMIWQWFGAAQAARAGDAETFESMLAEVAGMDWVLELCTGEPRSGRPIPRAIPRGKSGGGGWVRTTDNTIMSRVLYH